ncbi:MAG: 16S rRNA (guanine(966)-N(2))-methyltransferase RsmD [Pseudomonadota bacterium]
MRIVAGQWRGRRLAALGTGDAAAHLRPTSDRVREALFNVLAAQFGDPCAGARVLDLFAGTGALGFEALSRGAAHATFVDQGAKSHALLRKNASLLNCEPDVTLMRSDAARLPASTVEPVDLVFMDPPYGKGLGERAAARLIAGDWLADDALVIWEDNDAPAAPDDMTLVHARRYGQTQITIFRLTPKSEGRSRRPAR